MPFDIGLGRPVGMVIATRKVAVACGKPDVGSLDVVWPIVRPEGVGNPVDREVCNNVCVGLGVPLHCR